MLSAPTSMYREIISQELWVEFNMSSIMNSHPMTVGIGSGTPAKRIIRIG